MFAVALNYPPHAAEAGYAPPTDPLVFTKFPSCLIGPHATVVLLAELIAQTGWGVETKRTQLEWLAC